jgi:hypothetical protein
MRRDLAIPFSDTVATERKRKPLPGFKVLLPAKTANLDCDDMWIAIGAGGTEA